MSALQVRYHRGCLVMALLLLGACQGENTPPAPSENTATPAAQAPSENATILAKVNGEPIYVTDVESTIERTFSQSEQILLNDEARKKVLESLVAAKALKQIAEKQLSEADRNEIRQRTAAFEEELLVKAYLDSQVSPEPVTTEMVADYYNQHPERFSPPPLRHYQLLRTLAAPSEETRDALLAQLGQIRSETDWDSAAANWKTAFGLHLQSGQAAPGLLDPRLDTVMQGLNAGEVSEVVMLDGIPNLIKVTRLTQSEAKPLSDVSGEIRNSLAPLQIRKAVKTLADHAVNQAKVEYLSP